MSVNNIADTKKQHTVFIKVAFPHVPDGSKEMILYSNGTVDSETICSFHKYAQ